MDRIRGTRRTTPAGRRLTALSLALVVGVLGAGCTADSSGETKPELAEPSDAPTLQIEPVSDLGKVTGRLPRRQAEDVEQRISRIAVQWLSRAYVGGDYPRKSFPGSFDRFSRGARASALRERRVMTNAAIGRRVEELTPTAMSVTVDVLAVRKRAVAATARVRTAFRTTGRDRGRHRVTGRLMLTKDGGHWRAFAYHVSKGDR